MKKSLLLLLGFILFFGMFALAPAASQESEFYYVNVPILKIFPYKLGYYVIYRKSGLKTAEVYIPQPWFDRRDKRAVLNLDDGNFDPYMTFILKNGEFDHVRVVAAKNIRHPTWGTISPGADIADKFKVEKLAPEF